MQHFTDEAIARADLLSVAGRMQYRVEPHAGPIRFGGVLVLHTADGRVLRDAVEDAAGTGPRALCQADVERKARTVAPGPAIAGMIALLDKLERRRSIRGIVPG